MTLNIAYHCYTEATLFPISIGPQRNAMATSVVQVRPRTAPPLPLVWSRNHTPTALPPQVGVGGGYKDGAVGVGGGYKDGAASRVTVSGSFQAALGARTFELNESSKWRAAWGLNSRTAKNDSAFMAFVA
jgi:hypothetical protein